MTDLAFDPRATDDPEMPVNYEVEQALLSALLVDNALIDEVSGVLKPEHFAEPVHGQIYDVCAKRVAGGRVADHRSLAAVFDSHPALKDVDGGQYLRRLADSGLSVLPISVKSWAETLRDLWARRAVIQLAEDMVAEGSDLSADTSPAGLIERAEAALFDLTDRAGEGGPVRLGDLLSVTMADIEHKARHGSTALSTGFSELDRCTGGLEAPELIVVAGRPGMGKTMLVTNMAVRMARQGRGSLVFSLEMGNQAIGRRILAEQSSVPFADLQRPRNYDEVKTRLEATYYSLQQAPLWLDDRAALSIHQMHAAARRLSRQEALHLIVVDHLGYVTPPDPDANDVKKLGDVMKAAKAMGKDLGVPVIMLCQLSRSSLQHDDKRPRLEHLRGSGNIEEDADAVWFIHRDAYFLERSEPVRALYNTEQDYQVAADIHMSKLNDCRYQVDVIFAKQRNGPISVAKLRFDGSQMRIDDREEERP